MDAINLLCRGLVTVDQYEELKAAEDVARLERNERARARRQERTDRIRRKVLDHLEWQRDVFGRILPSGECMAKAWNVEIR